MQIWLRAAQVPLTLVLLNWSHAAAAAYPAGFHAGRSVSAASCSLALMAGTIVRVYLLLATATTPRVGWLAWSLSRFVHGADQGVMAAQGKPGARSLRGTMSAVQSVVRCDLLLLDALAAVANWQAGADVSPSVPQ